VAEAYLRGIERRIAEGKDPKVVSVASVFVSRWDKAIAKTAPDALRNGLGIAVGMQCYRAYRELLASARWQRLEAAGAIPQRLLWASTSTKDPAAPDTLYVEALAAPDTIDTLPDKTLAAFADHGRVDGIMARDGGDADARLARYADAGIDVDALAAQLQREGAASFVKSWQQLLQRIGDKAGALQA
jgi:transaldolase